MTDYKIIKMDPENNTTVIATRGERMPYVSAETKMECAAVIMEAGAKIVRMVAEDIKRNTGGW